MAASVDVSVEVLQECMIQEVTLDGQEIYVLPLSMSDNLTKMAHKIDFSKDELDLKNKQMSEVIEEEEEDDDENDGERQYPRQTVVQPSMWPWDSVRNKLRSALTEITVLQDILSIARDRRYITLDFVQHDATEAKSGLLLVARKKAMSTSGGFINSGMDRMKKNLDQILKNKDQDFHYELLKLRKTWRLKKVGGSILGDLSYKSAGSHYWVSGTFEVIKTDSEGVDSDTGVTTYQPVHSTNNQLPSLSNLNVTIPDDLSGSAYIRVVVKRVSEKDVNLDAFFSLNFLSSSFSSSSSSSLLSTSNEQLSWSKRLELAQNVIFCKELFAQLSQEALKIQSKIPNLSCGNHIVCHLFPDVKLFISLCHNTDTTNNNTNNNNTTASSLAKQHNIVLEHSVYQLLREIHHNNSITPMPHPVSAPLGFIKRRHHIGPGGFTKLQISDFNEGLAHGSILEQFVKQAKHYYNRQKVMSIIDDIVLEVHEPQIMVHTSYLNSSICTCVRLTIVFSGFELIKTCIVIYIHDSKLEVACKDGIFLTVDIGRKEIRRIILQQVAEHHLLTVNNLAMTFDWKVLALNKNCCPSRDYIVSRDGSYDDDECARMYYDEELTGESNYCYGILIISPNHNKTLSIHCFMNNTHIVKVSHKPSNQYQQRQAADGDLVAMEQQQQRPLHAIGGLTSKWLQAVDCFEFVQLDRLPGRNFAQRLEVLMAALMPEANK